MLRPKIKIAIADDHVMVRECFARALQTDRYFEVAGQADNGRKLLEIVKLSHPDIVLLDLEMPVMSGWETLPILRELYPNTKVIIVSTHFEGLLIKDLISRGVSGFLPKNADFETLLFAIYEVHAVGYFFSKQINKSVVRDLYYSKTIKPNFAEVYLTDAEIEILQHVCEDKITKEISLSLNRSYRTIDRIKHHFMKKLRQKRQQVFCYSR